MKTISKSKGALGLALGLASVLGGASLVARAQDGKKQPEPAGKITPWAAIEIALAKVPGRPLNANFEFAEGHWVYGVMVVSGTKIKEVEIDPMSGKVGDVEDITPAGEAKEMEEELNTAIGMKSSKAPAAPEKGEKGD